MSKDKKYYWLKLKVDFFEDIRIQKLRSVAGGDTYIIIFLKLMLISIKSEGTIRFENVFTSFAEELSHKIREKSKNIQIVLDFAMSHSMIEVIENEYFIPIASDNIGSENASAERKRRQREKEKNKKKANKNIRYFRV